MKIYDCITYCGEDLLLKIRFETLNNQVDKFIIIEGNRYFNGDKKPKFFDLNKFKKFKKKLNIIILKIFQNIMEIIMNMNIIKEIKLKEHLINLSQTILCSYLMLMKYRNSKIKNF